MDARAGGRAGGWWCCFFARSASRSSPVRLALRAAGLGLRVADRPLTPLTHPDKAERGASPSSVPFHFAPRHRTLVWGLTQKGRGVRVAAEFLVVEVEVGRRGAAAGRARGITFFFPFFLSLFHLARESEEQQLRVWVGKMHARRGNPRVRASLRDGRGDGSYRYLMAPSAIQGHITIRPQVPETLRTPPTSSATTAPSPAAQWPSSPSQPPKQPTGPFARPKQG